MFVFAVKAKKKIFTIYFGVIEFSCFMIDGTDAKCGKGKAMLVFFFILDCSIVVVTVVVVGGHSS